MPDDEARPDAVRSAFSMTVEECPPYVVARIGGDVDAETAGAVRRTLHDLMVDGRVDVLVDLSAITFIDSVGLGVLVAAHKRARVFRGSFALVAPSPVVTRVLGLTALDRVLRCYLSQDEALATGESHHRADPTELGPPIDVR